MRMQTETISKGETRYLTVAQLAKRLQISESTVYGWVDRDYIPFLMAGDLLRFDPIAIDAWMIAGADRKREKKRTPHVRMVK
jgi:excisionase family DNA binding protein